MEALLEQPIIGTSFAKRTSIANGNIQSIHKPSKYADYKALDVDDNFWYELLNGELVKKSSPTPRHQLIVVRLIIALTRHNETAQIGGVVLTAPVDVFVDDENVPQPDVLYISEARREIITSDGVMGAPDLVMEVISPSSVDRDRNLKRRLYQRLGAQEYWILDPNNQTIEVFTLTSDGYDIYSFAAERGSVESSVLQGFSVNVEDLMK
jgi:Uma2 family endonuclease